MQQGLLDALADGGFLIGWQSGKPSTATAQTAGKRMSMCCLAHDNPFGLRTASGAFSGKVDAGFPQKMRPTKEDLERVPLQLDRNAL